MNVPMKAPLAMLALLFAPPSHADWHFTPTVELKETYTDNVALARDGLARSQFVSELAPGFTLTDDAPSLRLRAAYQLHYYRFADNDIAGAGRSQNQLALDAQAKLVDDLLHLDTSASISQQAISAFGQQANGNGYADANRADVKSYRVSPYLTHRFDNVAAAELRYTRDAVSAGASGLGNSKGDKLGLNLASGRAFRRFGWSLAASSQNLSDSAAPDSRTRMLSGALRYAFSPDVAASATGGRESYDYQSLGEASGGKFWNVGLDWAPFTRTTVKLGGGRHYYGSSYFLDARHHSRHSVWSIGYNDAVTTTRSQFLLPSTVDTTALLDRLFSATIADPAARALAVEAYLRATGLPPSLPNNVNYFSNRYMLQKQLQASAAFNTARSTLVVNLFHSHRNALSSRQTDSSLFGSSSTSLNDDTSQTGATAMANWQIGGRDALSLTVNGARVKSLSSDVGDHNRAVRLGATHQFRAKLKGSVELRRIGGTVQGTNAYHENALAAALSMQL